MLVAFGITFGAYAHLILLNVPLTAFSLACIIIGVTLIITPSTPVPKEVVRAMVESACTNIEALLEEFQVSGRAIYILGRDGRVYTFIPLTSNPHKVGIDDVARAPIRVLTRVKEVSGLILFPPGSDLPKLSGLTSGLGVEEALRHVLVDYVEGVEGVRVVRDGDRIFIDIVKPTIKTSYPRFVRALGSLATCLSGCTLAYILNKPVVFEDEWVGKASLRATFRVG